MDRLAPSRVTVLLAGGSEPLQRAIARSLHRRPGPFISIDCEATPDLEVTLFGGPPWALDARGAVHEVGTGTLYVARIHALPLALQPRFLSYLDEGAARVIVSTNRDLGSLRRDLAQRLELVRIELR